MLRQGVCGGGTERRVPGHDVYTKQAKRRRRETKKEEQERRIKSLEAELASTKNALGHARTTATKLKNTLDFKSRATDLQEENQTGWGGSEDEMHKAAAKLEAHLKSLCGGSVCRAYWRF